MRTINRFDGNSRFVLTILCALALVMGVLVSSPAAAQEQPWFISATFYGDVGAQPRVDAGGWTLDEQVHLTVSDVTGVVFSAVMEQAPPWGPPVPTIANFDMGDYWLQGGETLTIIGAESGFVQSIVVSHIRIDEIDYDNDVVRGSGASLGGFLKPQGPDPLLCDQAVTLNPGGTWVVDWTGCYDITPYSFFEIHDMLQSGGWTSVRIEPPPPPPVPAIQVVSVGDYVDLLNFAPKEVFVTVNGIALDPAPDGGNGDVRVSLAYYGIDLSAGDVVVASQDGSIAEVTTVHVQITAASPATGIVSGLAPDGAVVNVAAWTDNGSAERVTTAVDGAFSVNFSIQGGLGDPEPNIVTLTPGSPLAAWVYDDPHTGDASKHDWQVPAPLTIDGVDTGVANQVLPDGSTFADLIAQASAEASNHGDFVSAVSKLTKDWKKAGLISGSEKGLIISAASGSSLP